MTHLVMVSDASKKGIGVVKTIKSVADELVMYEKAGVIINRIPDENVKKYIEPGDLEVLAYIGQDSQLSEYDITGKNVFYMPVNSQMVKGVEAALEKLLAKEK